MFFGREPRLPLDVILGTNYDEGPDGEWASHHYQKLKEAFSLASQKTEKEALKRMERVNRSADDSPIAVGTRVFLKNHPKGRSKIQDIWKETPYRVTERHDNNTYTVERLEGERKEKHVHRKEMLDSKELIPEIHRTPCVVREDILNDPVKALSESGSESEEEYILSREAVLSRGAGNNHRDCTGNAQGYGAGNEDTALDKAGEHQSEEKYGDTPDSSFSREEEEDSGRQSPLSDVDNIPLRRSGRPTAGKNSNPHNMLRSVLNQETKVDTQILSNISQTQLILVQMLAGIRPSNN